MKILAMLFLFILAIPFLAKTRMDIQAIPGLAKPGCISWIRNAKRPRYLRIASVAVARQEGSPLAAASCKPSGVPGVPTGQNQEGLLAPHSRMNVQRRTALLAILVSGSTAWFHKNFSKDSKAYTSLHKHVRRTNSKCMESVAEIASPEESQIRADHSQVKQVSSCFELTSHCDLWLVARHGSTFRVHPLSTRLPSGAICSQKHITGFAS